MSPIVGDVNASISRARGGRTLQREVAARHSGYLCVCVQFFSFFKIFFFHFSR